MSYSHFNTWIFLMYIFETQDFFFCTLVLWKKARHYDLFYRENRDDRVTYTAYDTEL